MKNSVLPACLFSAISTLLVAGCDAARDREIEHQADSDGELEPMSLTVFGERVLLFMEYPPLVRGESARFLAHLSVLDTGEPIRTGRVTLSIGATELVADGPKRDGLFVPEGSLPSAGAHPATLLVESERARETLDLGRLTVHASSDDARSASKEASGSEPAGAVPFLMEQQWRIKLLLAEAEPRRLARRLVVPAQVRSPEGAEVVVSPPVAGRLLAPETGRLPRTGDVVELGDVLGFVEPPLGAADLAQLQALRLEFELRSLDIVRALSEARARLDYATREHDRISKLREHGLSTAQELDQAERDLAVVRSAAEGAQATKESLDRLRVKRLEPADGEAPSVRFPLVAPLRGSVIAAGRLQGESVEASDELFRILDTSHVWVEGRVSEFDLHLVSDSAAGVVTFAALPGARFPVGAERSGRLEILPVIDSQSRTAILRCEVPSADGSIKPGMMAELEIATAQVDAAVVVPVEAIVVDQGLPTAYVMVEGELFQKRDLELGVKDGELVEVRRGIAVGERVATRGAYVVKLAALSPASFGAGHQH